MRRKKLSIKEEFVKVGDSYLGFQDILVYTDDPRNLDDDTHYYIWYNNQKLNWLEVTYSLINVFLGEYPEYFDMMKSYLQNGDLRSQEAFDVFIVFMQTFKDVMYQFLASCNASKECGYPSLEILFYQLWMIDDAKRKTKIS